MATLDDFRSALRAAWDHGSIRAGIDDWHHSKFARAQADTHYNLTEERKQREHYRTLAAGERITISLTPRQSRVVLGSIYGGVPEVVKPIQNEILGALAKYEARESEKRTIKLTPEVEVRPKMRQINVESPVAEQTQKKTLKETQEYDLQREAVRANLRDQGGDPAKVNPKGLDKEVRHRLGLEENLSPTLRPSSFTLTPYADQG